MKADTIIRSDHFLTDEFIETDSLWGIIFTRDVCKACAYL